MNTRSLASNAFFVIAAGTVAFIGLLFILGKGCEKARSSQTAKREEVWEELTAEACTAKCSPLPVLRFIPGCGREDPRYAYFCIGEYHEDPPCICGVPSARPVTIVEPAP